MYAAAIFFVSDNKYLETMFEEFTGVCFGRIIIVMLVKKVINVLMCVIYMLIAFLSLWKKLWALSCNKYSLALVPC